MTALGTQEERVKLLKAGFSGKQIEKMYVALNDFKIVDKILKKIGSWKEHAKDSR
jgi:hypothetical protein